MIKTLLSISLIFTLLGCSDKSTANIERGGDSSSSGPQAKVIDYSAGHAMNQRLGHGFNLGNAFDAECYRNCQPNLDPTCTDMYAPAKWDGCWSNPIEESYITTIKAAGFQSIRLPIRWSEKATNVYPFTINPSFIARVHEVINQIKAAGMPVIINIHHFNELYDDGKQRTDLELQKQKFVELWRQIATEFKDEPNDLVVFELLNEPRSRITKEILNSLIAEVWPIIRATNPGRTIMVNPVNWGNFNNIPGLVLPEDGNVIASGHMYQPHEFTHQGTSTQYPEGVVWGGKADQDKLLLAFQTGYESIKGTFPGADGGTIPLNIGEFGATVNADVASRAAYSLAVCQNANRLGMSWHYWGFTGTNFDAWDKNTQAWIPEILSSLQN